MTGGTNVRTRFGQAGQLLRRGAASSRPRPDGVVVHVGPEDAGWSYLEFGARRLDSGRVFERAGDDREVLVCVLEGSARIEVADRRFERVGDRATVFDSTPAGVVLAEPGATLRLEALGGALVAIATAPGGGVRRTARIQADEILVETRGSGNTERRIHHLLPPAAEAGRLIAFEVITPGGNWSSYPPHKHDTEDPPHEAYLEEIYFYRFALSQGFALQRVYTPDRSLDEVLAPGDGDLVLIPRGYHPVGAPAGYDCYYLNVMAGHHRDWNFTVDPDHAWLMNWDPTGVGT